MSSNPNVARYVRTPPAQAPRIIIYGVGQYGAIVAKIALKKGWPVVGAVNRAGGKIGQDLGAVLGLGESLGILVQDCETADYAAMNADIAIVLIADYLRDTFPAYQRLLSCGINVICHAGQASYAWGADPALAEAIDALAKQNNATLTGASLWDMSRVGAGLLVVGPCTDLTALTHTSITDVSKGGVHAMDFCGVGISQEEVARRMSGGKSPLGGFHTGNVLHVLHQLGFTAAKVTERNEAIYFDAPIYCAALERELTPGTSVGTRIVSVVETREGVTATLHTELRLLLAGEHEYVEWRVDGMPDCTIRVDRKNSVYHSAASMFNRIPDVIAAPPGLQLFSDLGPLKHTALLPNVKDFIQA